MPEATTAATTAAPTVPLKPASAPTPGPSPMEDAYADLDAMVAAGSKSEPSEPKPDKPKSVARTADKPSPDKPSTGKQPEKDSEQDTSASIAETKQPGKKVSPSAELRTAYEALKLKHKQLEAEHQALRNAPPKEDPERKSLEDRLSEREKRLADLENEIRFSAYERSQEYKEKFEQPFVDAYQTGRAKVATLKITDADGNYRQATPEDFDRIARIMDDDTAAEAAAEMFGNRAPVVLYHRERVQELNASRIKAIEDYKKLGGEREKQWQEQTAKQREQIGKLWKQANTEAIEKYPHFFKPIDGDDEGNQLLEQGFQMADAAFSDNGNMTPEQRVKLHSAIRNRAAGFSRLAYQNKQLTAKIAELEQKLSEYESSEPGQGEGGGKKTETPEISMDSALNELDKLAK